MKVLVAGATGALGTQLVPRLVAAGHQVTGTTRSKAKFLKLRDLGAMPVVMDALDPDAVADVVAAAEPDVIVHQATALSGSFDMRHFDRTFAETNRLRIEGTDHLLAAGRAVDVRRFVAQSYAGWPSARTGGPVKTEDDPLDPDPPKAMRGTLEAMRHLDAAATGPAGQREAGRGRREGRGLRGSGAPAGRGRGGGGREGEIYSPRARKFPI